MTEPDPPARELRVLILGPTSKDASMAHAILEHAGLLPVCCRDLDQACDELDAGAAALLVAEEIVLGDESDQLATWLGRQPPWSDLPIVLLAKHGADSPAVARAIDRLGNVTVLERPTRVASLVSTARTALNARRRQYQIREHLTERENAEAALRAGDRRKDEFLAILAHELRNPLAPILNSLHLLRLTATSEPTIVKVGEMMDRQIGHLVRLVDDLMEIARINQGKIELRKELIDLAVVIHTAVEACRPLIDSAGHRLTTTLPGEPLILEADPVRLTQVIENLLNNAAKYTEPGGDIELTVRAEGATALISVCDSGFGIPLEMLPRIFDPFTQVDRGAARAQGGLGIGLTLVKNLVDLHCGTIVVRSGGIGKGSQFLVRLPLHVGAPIAEKPPLQAPASGSRPSRVLVVDDNRDAADSLGFLLRSLGCEVRIAYGGTDALEVLPAYRPTAVLLDIGMPGMDGHEVARRIRQQAAFREVTLIALSGWGQAHDRHRSQLAGFDHHLIKPADVRTLEMLLLSAKPTGTSGVRPSRKRRQSSTDSP